MNQVADLFEEQAEINRRRAKLQALGIVINSLAMEVNFKGLAFTDCQFSPSIESFRFEVRPVDTESFSSCFSISVYFDDGVEYPKYFAEAVRDLNLALEFLRGLLAHGKPMKAYRPVEVAA